MFTPLPMMCMIWMYVAYLMIRCNCVFQSKISISLKNSYEKVEFLRWGIEEMVWLLTWYKIYNVRIPCIFTFFFQMCPSALFMGECCVFQSKGYVDRRSSRVEVQWASVCRWHGCAMTTLTALTAPMRKLAVRGSLFLS